jgi:hypothetical protein
VRRSIALALSLSRSRLLVPEGPGSAFAFGLETQAGLMLPRGRRAAAATGHELR